jgi:hypothetical protein
MDMHVPWLALFLWTQILQISMELIMLFFGQILGAWTGPERGRH